MTELETGTASAASPAEAVAETPVTETAAPAPEATSEAPASTIDDDLKAVWDKAHAPARERDETGKFVSKNPVEPPAEGAAPETTEGQAPEGETAEPAKPAIPAPHSWPADMKAKWDALPPDAREFIAKRESDAHTAISRMGQQVKALEPVANVLEQHKAVFERNGLDYQQGVAALLKAQVMLEENPHAAIQQLAQAYGVDLSGLSTGQGTAGGPQIAALQAQIAQLSRQVQENTAREMERQKSAEAAKVQSLEQVVAEFTKDKPDFSELEDDVLVMLPAIRQRMPDASPRELLTKAYEDAQWANPAARARKLEAEAAKKAKEAAAVAAKAKQAGSLNVRTTQSSASDRRTIDDDLREIARRHYS